MANAAFSVLIVLVTEMGIESLSITYNIKFVFLFFLFYSNIDIHVLEEITRTGREPFTRIPAVFHVIKK